MVWSVPFRVTVLEPAVNVPLFCQSPFVVFVGAPEQVTLAPELTVMPAACAPAAHIKERDIIIANTALRRTLIPLTLPSPLWGEVKGEGEIALDLPTAMWYSLTRGDKI